MLYDSALEPFVEELRAFNAKQAAAPRAPGPPPISSPPGALPAEDIAGPGGMALHVLRPPKVDAVFLHMHGGGFVFGTPAMADGGNSELAKELNAGVVSIDYRLAPKVRHADQVQDCLAAALWLLEHAKTTFGTEKLFIGGDLAGANLAVHTLLRLRDKGLVRSFACAVLNVGMFDISMSPSQRLAPDSYFLSAKRLREGNEKVFPGVSYEELRAPAISPLYADLTGLPPAIFSIGTEDSMFDDSMFMAARWRAAGNEAELQIYPEGTHLFMNTSTAMAGEAKRRIQHFVRTYI